MPRDPVCGMNVKDDKNAIKSDYNGQTFYFCSNRCRDEFRRNPEAYIRTSGSNNGNTSSNRINDVEDQRQGNREFQ